LDELTDSLRVKMTKTECNTPSRGLKMVYYVKFLNGNIGFYSPKVTLAEKYSPARL